MFRFTIRELVLLTLLVAMGVAWWLDRSQIEANLASSEIKVVETTRLVDLLLVEERRTRHAIEESGHVVVENFKRLKLERQDAQKASPDEN